MSALSAASLGRSTCVTLKSVLHAASTLPLPPGVPSARSLPSLLLRLLLHLKPQPTSLSPDAAILLTLRLPPELLDLVHAKLLQ